jgi:hypothetical protein
MIDTHAGIGVLGVATGWGLADIHLISATAAALLTTVYMGYVLYRKIKDDR